MGGHFDAQSPSIAFKGGGHFDVSHPVPKVAYFNLMGLYVCCELSDMVMGFSETLLGGCCSPSYGGDEAIGDGVHGVVKVAILVHVEDHFHRSR